jgi:hypothetical protein
MKLSIKAELVYCFAEAAQIIANLEASQTSDQTISQNRSTFSRRCICFPTRPLMAIA